MYIVFQETERSLSHFLNRARLILNFYSVQQPSNELYFSSEPRQSKLLIEVLWAVSADVVVKFLDKQCFRSLTLPNTGTSTGEYWTFKYE